MKLTIVEPPPKDAGRALVAIWALSSKVWKTPLEFVAVHRVGFGPPADYQSWSYATDAHTALTQLEEEYHRWIAGVHTLTDEDLGRPCGPAEGPYAEHSMAELVLHINREVIHHGAEIACIRDLYTHRTH